MTEENKVSTRNLVDTGLGPLRRVTGILDSMPREPQTYEGGRTANRININLKDIEVIEAVEPYHFPIYTIQVNESNRKKSRWGAIAESFNSAVDAQYSPAQIDPSSPEYVAPKDRPDIGDYI